MTARTRFDLPTLALLTLPPLFWAGNAVVGRGMVGLIAPLGLSFWRWFVALALALPFTAAVLWRERAVLRRQWARAAWLGFLGVGCYNSLQYIALHTATPLDVSLITASAPVFILLIGALLYREAVDPRALAGAALSLAGVAVVVSTGRWQVLAALHWAPGDLIMVVAVALWGVYTWELRRRPLALPPLASLSAQMAWGVVFIAPFAAFERWVLGVPTHWGMPVALAIGYVALAPSLLAYACWGIAVARTGAQLPAYFGNLAPVFVALLSVLFLHQGIASYHVIGALLIFAGIRVALGGRARVGR